MTHPSGSQRRVAALTPPLLVLLLLPVALLVTHAPPAGAIDWVVPVRVTTNTVEDRTTSGSLFHFCIGEAFAVWQQAVPGAGWQIMAADLVGSDWSEPEAIDPGLHPDYQPRVAVETLYRFDVVWQRGSSTAAEIVFARREFTGGPWTIEPVTTNGTEDVTPDVADGASDATHVVWAGFDPTSGLGKVFHAVRSAGGAWSTEVLDDSVLGPFWTGAAPRVAVADGIVHVVYRGGDFGGYHAHYARLENGTWSYAMLASGNANDLGADVVAEGPEVRVAMSGNDCFGCPNRIYVRRSHDGGQTFEPAQLASGGLSAVLDNATWHPWTGTQVVGSEVSGNLYTGNVVISLEDAGWQPELVPPADQGSSAPSGGIHRCVTDRGGDRQTGAHSVLYTHMAGIEADSAEVWFVATPEAGAIDDAGTPRLDIVSPVVRAAPNPFATRTWIEIDGLAARAAPALTVHDVAGRIVRTLAARPGRHRYAWDGKDAAGRDVASGIYYVRIEGLPRDARTGDAPGRLVVVR